MNVGYLAGFISNDISESTVSLKDGTTLKKARFSIAVNRRVKDGGADFIFVTALGKNAENIIKFFGKGKGIMVEYHVQTGSYTDKSGKKVYSEDKIVDKWEFPPIRKNDGEDNISQDVQQMEIKTDAEMQPSAPDDGFMNIPADMDAIMGSLPFK